MTEIIGNRYILIRRIGNGGMADVFLAKDTVLDREVALKRLRGEMSTDPVSLLRFQREATAASRLSHQGIVEVYDVGEDNGQHYIVMEVVRGTTLKELIHRRGALDKFEAVAIIKQLAQALQVAHANQVIHRDIKPQNVLIKDDGTVKLTDFGIALAGDAIQLTRHDSVLGSVHYMAPELSRGEGATKQSDIYALGVVFYELLTGEIPYRGENPVEIAMKHMRDPFPSVQKFNPSLPNSIVNVIAKATVKNRNYRYRNIDEFIEDLSDILDPSRADEPLWEFETPEDDQGTRVLGTLTEEEAELEAKKKKRKKMMIIGGSVAAVVVVGLFAWFLFKPKPKVDIQVPKVTGMTVEEAKVALEQLGLNVNASVSYSYSDEYESGIVMATKPGEGATVAKGDQIKLTVSHGKMFEVGDYTGMTVEAVTQALKDVNVEIKTVTEPRKDMAPGIVISQSGLNPGDKIVPNQRRELTLTVSSKMQLLIPDVTGKSVAAAKQELEALGIVTRTELLPQAGLSLAEIKELEYNVVKRTNPLAGSYYVQDEGSSVTLYYYEKMTNPEPETKPEPEKPDTGNPDNGKPESGNSGSNKPGSE